MTSRDRDEYARKSRRETIDTSERTPTQRDRDRVLYSESFRRLGGVTQVASGTPDMSLHNRLVHSLKVEQIGSSIVSRMRARYPENGQVIDQYAVAAACLAHDIGHPPFGHAGEQELHELLVCERHQSNPRSLQQRQRIPCKDCVLEDGFEGNAQTFRILAVLGVHRGAPNKPVGLDLTRLTLAAVSKYPWTRGARKEKLKKWGAYDCDAEILTWALGGVDSDPSLEAQVMDWADDISYAVHDIEDFFRVGLVPIDDYRRDTRQLRTFLDYIQDPHALGPIDKPTINAFTELIELFPSARFNGTAEDLADLDNLRSTLLSNFIEATKLEERNLDVNEQSRLLNSMLKQLIWFHIIDEPRLANIQTGQRRVLKDIFQSLLDVASRAYGADSDGLPNEKQLRRLPQGLRRSIELGIKQESKYQLDKKVARGVIDYIASLSDGEAYSLHATLRGREMAGHL